jgi:hypothetical protein
MIFQFERGSSRSPFTTAKGHQHLVKKAPAGPKNMHRHRV